MSIHFRIGDQCLVNVDGKQYKGDILTGLHKNVVEVRGERNGGRDREREGEREGGREM